MKRIHLFEWEDQRWLPASWRADLTELLRHQVGEIYRPVLPVLARWLRRNGCDAVLDLCSGAGGPWPVLIGALRQEGLAPSVLLTDRHPHLEPETATARSEALQVHPLPVDARSVPRELTGCRTLFTGFHHFRPDEARALLRQAADGGVPIAIFEFTERRWGNVLGMLLSPLLVWGQTPKVRPFRWGRLLRTYLLPLIPFLYLWDGLVSHLRTYTLAELEEMAPSLERPGYRWEAGRLQDPASGQAITYLLGGSL